MTAWAVDARCWRHENCVALELGTPYAAVHKGQIEWNLKWLDRREHELARVSDRGPHTLRPFGHEPLERLQKQNDGNNLGEHRTGLPSEAELGQKPHEAKEKLARRG